MEIKVQREQQADLHARLWAMANDLRGTLEPYQFKDYILGLLFYKFLSEKTETFANEILEADGLTYEEGWADEDIQEALKEEMLEALGYVLEPKYLFKSLIAQISDGSFSIETLEKAINSLTESTIGYESESTFEGLFEDMRLDDIRIGREVSERSKLISKVLSRINDLNFGHGEMAFDVLGNAYEYLIGMFAQSAGKKAGEFFSPQVFVSIVSQLAIAAYTGAMPDPAKKLELKNVNDPTCGSGGLLLKMKEYANVRHYYGSELTSTTYNLARMNLLLHDVKYDSFTIKNTDTLERPAFLDDKFQIQLANPPYSVNWSSAQSFLTDPRFEPFGKLAPKTKGDFAFVQHIIHNMDDNGVATILLPHGVLFRGAAEEVIRKHLIEKMNILDAVVGLPGGCFQGTDIPVVALVLKKDRKNTDVLFIDASKEFVKGKNQNTLTDEQIAKVVQTYVDRKDIDKYAHVAPFEELKENEFNLNIPRYVDTFEEEEIIDLVEVQNRLKALDSEIAVINKELAGYFKELGI